MKKLSKWKINIFAPITFLLIFCIVATGSTAWFIGNFMYEHDRINYVGGYLEEWVNDINAKGVQWFLDEAAEAPQDAVLPEGCNLVLLNKDGEIIYSRNDDFLQGKTKLNLMISPYGAYRPGWVYKQSDYTTYWRDEFARLALLVNDVGEIQASIRLVHSEETPNSGKTLPKYATYFPTLNYEYYRDALNDVLDTDEMSRYNWSAVGSTEAKADDEWDTSDEYDGYDSEPTVTSENLPMQTDPWDDWGDQPQDQYRSIPSDPMMAIKAKNYVQWENAQMSRAGDMRMIYRGPAWDGTQVMVFYRDTDAMHGAYIRNIERERHVGMLNSVLVALTGLILLSLAAWVFVDAKKRNFHPAMWGILTLIGNVIAWIVYRLVRPNNRVAKGCPNCGAPSKPTHAFCPVCGHALCDKCTNCGHILEPTWHFCPSCGQDIHPAELPPPQAPQAPQTQQSDIPTTQ